MLSHKKTAYSKNKIITTILQSEQELRSKQNLRSFVLFCFVDLLRPTDFPLLHNHVSVLNLYVSKAIIFSNKVKLPVESKFMSPFNADVKTKIIQEIHLTKRSDP